MPVARAGTLLIPSGPYHDPDRKHLFVICNDECESGNHIVVPINSWTGDRCDETCRLAAYEHAFLRHESFVLYRKAEIKPALSLRNGVQQGVFTLHDPMNAQTFLRVKNGVCRSIHTPRKVKRALGCT